MNNANQSWEEREIFTLIGALSPPNQDRVMELVRSLAKAIEYRTSDSVLTTERDRLAGSLAACGVIARCDDEYSFEKWYLPEDNPASTDSYKAVARLRQEATEFRNALRYVRTNVGSVPPHKLLNRAEAALGLIHP